MSPELVVAALGATVVVDVSALDGRERDAVSAAWAGAGAIAGSPERDEAAPTVAPAGGGDLDVLLATLSQEVTAAAITARRGELWMLHAAGLALPDGRVVVLVGPSGRGKTTAAATLGRGLGYVSDETVAVDAAGRVWPYRKPLSIIEAEGVPKVQRSPGELGLLPLPEDPLRLAAIVLLDRRDDAEEPVVEEVELGDALAELVAQSSFLPELPHPLRTIAGLIRSVGGVRRVVYRESGSLADVSATIIAGARAAAEPGVAADPAADGIRSRPAPSRPSRRIAGVGAGAAAGSEAGPRFIRTPAADALPLDAPDRIALLHVGADGEGTFRLLAGVAPAVWRASDAATLDELVDAAVAVYGAPDPRAPDGVDARALVAAAVAELVTAEILETDAGAVRSESCWRVRDDVAWTDNGDSVAVLALADAAAEPLALAGSAALIWRAVAGASGAGAGSSAPAAAVGTAGVGTAGVGTVGVGTAGVGTAAAGTAPGTAGAGTAGVTTAEVVARVAAWSGMDGSAIADDVASFLARLENARLVDRPDLPGSPSNPPSAPWQRGSIGTTLADGSAARAEHPTGEDAPK